MKKLKEVLRLKYESKLANRPIARAVGISPGTVSNYTQAFSKTGLSWLEAKALDESLLIERLIPLCKQLRIKQGKACYSEPNFASLRKQLKQKGVNLQLLWEEYCQSCQTKAYSYSQFCRQYREFCKQFKMTLRLEHKAGEKCFIDYCGPRIPIYTRDGKVTAKAYVFVASLGLSDFTFTTATLTRSLPDWISANVDALNYFGGVPEMMVPDNEKSAVKDACYYDPDVNPTYADFARHYETVILPTRPGYPQDKAKVEKAVQFVETRIIAKLRHCKFYSIEALNQAIAVLLVELNDRPFQKREGTRRSQFESLEKSALKPLPAQPYELARFQKATVAHDYHVYFDKHAYSVPYQLIRKTVECRLTHKSIEVFHQGQCVARHRLNSEPGKATTLDEHMPNAHRYHREWSPAKFEKWSKDIGPAMKEVAGRIIKAQPHPECCYRIHNGFRQLNKNYGADKLESACQYALVNQAVGFKHIKLILLSGAFQLIKASNDAPCNLPQTHEHVRGADYYLPTTTKKELATC